MQITVQLPDDLSRHPDPGREALEQLVIEGYKTGALSHFLGGEMLGFSRLEFESFLKEKQVIAKAYDADDLEYDLGIGKQIRAHGLQR
jgi:predicted HTH domain antitoxin